MPKIYRRSIKLNNAWIVAMSASNTFISASTWEIIEEIRWFFVRKGLNILDSQLLLSKCKLDPISDHRQLKFGKAKISYICEWFTFRLMRTRSTFNKEVFYASFLWRHFLRRRTSLKMTSSFKHSSQPSRKAPKYIDKKKLE